MRKYAIVPWKKPSPFPIQWLDRCSTCGGCPFVYDWTSLPFLYNLSVVPSATHTTWVHSPSCHKSLHSICLYLFPASSLLTWKIPKPPCWFRLKWTVLLPWQGWLKSNTVCVLLHTAFLSKARKASMDVVLPHVQLSNCAYWLTPLKKSPDGVLSAPCSFTFISELSSLISELPRKSQKWLKKE